MKVKEQNSLNKRQEKIETHKLNNIKAKDFIQILRMEKPFILDVRTKDEIKQGYLPNTTHIPLTQFIREIKNNKTDILERIPKQQSIYVVCFGDTHIRSILVCNMLKHEGYNHVSYIDGGIQGIYKALKDSDNLDLISDTSFYMEDDLKCIFKVDNQDLKPDFIDGIPNYIQKNLLSLSNISIDPHIWWEN